METIPSSGLDLRQKVQPVLIDGIEREDAPSDDRGDIERGSATRSFRSSYRAMLTARRSAFHGQPEEELALVRALNNDNHMDTVRMVRLFRNHYGTEHPFQKVYETQFWSNGMHSRLGTNGLVSLVAVQNDNFIAHLAYDADHDNNAVQILLPAIDPQHRQQLFPLIREFWKKIENTAARQDWSLVYTYNLISQPLLQLLAAKCFHCEAAALLPCGQHDEESATDPHHCSSVLVMCNILQTRPLERKVLYPPLQHARRIKEMLESLSLLRSFGTDDGAPPAEIRPASGNGSDKRFSLQVIKNPGLYLLQINGPEMSDLSAAISVVERLERAPKIRNKSLIVRIAMEDPRCPEFCEALEIRGYRFCGVFPLLGGHDCVAYARYDDSTIRRLTLYTERSKDLRRYMLGCR